MGYFADPAELDRYIGETFRRAADHPEVGPKLKAVGLVMRVIYTDPDCELTVVLREDLQIIAGPADVTPDITMTMRGDTADQFWRGRYNLAVGLAKGEVQVKGQINKILKLVPLTKPLIPVYRELVQEKDQAGG